MSSIRLFADFTDIHSCLCVNCKAAIHILTCRGLTELQGMEYNVALTSLTLSTYHMPSLNYFFPPYCVRLYLTVCCFDVAARIPCVLAPG